MDYQDWGIIWKLILYKLLIMTLEVKMLFQKNLGKKLFN